MRGHHDSIITDLSDYVIIAVRRLLLLLSAEPDFTTPPQSLVCRTVQHRAYCVDIVGLRRQHKHFVVHSGQRVNLKLQQHTTQPTQYNSTITLRYITIFNVALVNNH